MTAFQVLIIKEHVEGDIQRLDNRLCILYDHDEGQYYFYGTRNNDGKTSYNDYSGSYAYYQKKGFCNFLDFLLGKYDEVLTTEVHVLDIQEKDYANLSWEYFLQRLNVNTLLSAYDVKKESRKSINNYLEMLVHW